MDMPGGEWNRTGETAEAKAALRRLAASRRDALEAPLREYWSREACGLAWAWMTEAGYASLMAYAAIRSELDAGSLLDQAWSASMEVFLPRVAAGGLLETGRVRSRSELVPGVFGIPEPAPAACRASGGALPELVLVPGLAFDESGGRLGYGRGYYDRLLTRLEEEAAGSGRQRPVRAGLCFSAQVVPEVPVDGKDRFMDMLITEKGITICKGRA